MNGYVVVWLVGVVCGLYLAALVVFGVPLWARRRRRQARRRHDAAVKAGVRCMALPGEWARTGYVPGRPATMWVERPFTDSPLRRVRLRRARGGRTVAAAPAAGVAGTEGHE